MTASIPTVPATRGETPSLRRRLASLVYEILLLFGVSLLPGAIGALLLAITGRPQDTALRLIAFAIFGLYFVWFWSRRGQTLPMQTWRIRLVTAHGKRLSIARASARYLVGCAWVAPATVLASLNGWTGWHLLGAVGVGVVAYAMLALLHPQRQFWHDALCGTRLVDAHPQDHLTT
jgi:uncharacterized RDD family membrane protein YckC